MYANIASKRTKKYDPDEYLSQLCKHHTKLVLTKILTEEWEGKFLHTEDVNLYWQALPVSSDDPSHAHNDEI